MRVGCTIPQIGDLLSAFLPNILSRTKKLQSWATSKTRDERVRLIQDAAVGFVKKYSVQALSFRSLARMPTLNLSPAASLHYFGSSVGLLGAVAERGFSELAEAVRKARKNADAPHIAVALAHARYGLEKKDLYRALHDPRLWQWQYATEPVLRESAKTNEQQWVQRAIDARGAAFKEYVEAVHDAQKRGILRAQPNADTIAHLLAVLVDGYLFQHLEEQIGSSWAVSRHLAYLMQLLELISEGLEARG